jgi:hypothetical protein
VYAFGLGGTGQLGTKAVRSAATPQVVLGPWVSPGGVSVVEAGIQNKDASNYIVKRIYSGGDHCFATVTHKEVSPERRLHLNLEGLACMVENVGKLFSGYLLNESFLPRRLFILLHPLLLLFFIWVTGLKLSNSFFLLTVPFQYLDSYSFLYISQCLLNHLVIGHSIGLSPLH